ncbi:RHS repeat-associated core domain-containing protein [Dactylosporangium sp. NPDC005572]|uniref:RHS repeat-associated core domain-containing protein n=1 Tax=Dactylosporangium sp. NPDC005572 TaxID=3156889 RepID=UPI0033B95578
MPGRAPAQAGLARWCRQSQDPVGRRQTPFGGLRGAAPASWPTEKGYVGGDNDPTGLVHLGAREYDPKIGRFISVDPILDLSDPQQLHGYAYSENNPINRSDPGGLKSNWKTSSSARSTTPRRRSSRRRRTPPASPRSPATPNSSYPSSRSSAALSPTPRCTWPRSSPMNMTSTASSSS